MLTILTDVALKGATDPGRGNVQSFLERLLIEVVSENYRYFANEHLSHRAYVNENAHMHCWPPLLANERQVSGLFAVGLSRVCPVSIPEHGISRSFGKASSATQESKSGRIDFLATFGSRHIALELKRCPIATIGDARSKAGLKFQWNAVSSQAKQALVHMRRYSNSYSSPVSIGLLVVRISRKVTSRQDVESMRDKAERSLPEIAQQVKKLTSADFLGYYIPPREMQVSYGWGKDEDQYRVYPGVVFAAVVHGNTR